MIVDGKVVPTVRDNLCHLVTKKGLKIKFDPFISNVDGCVAFIEKNIKRIPGGQLADIVISHPALFTDKTIDKAVERIDGQ